MKNLGRSNYVRKMLMRQEREKRWDFLIDKYKVTYEPWNYEEIEETLRNLQEYFSSDSLEIENITEENVDQLLTVLNDILKVTIAFHNALVHSNILYSRKYVTSKLCAVLHELRPIEPLAR
jgi:hypothetical protein